MPEQLQLSVGSLFSGIQSEDLTSASNEPDSGSPGSASSMTSAGECSLITGQTCLDIPMSEALPAQRSRPWMFYAEASRVRTSQMPAPEWALWENDRVFGPSSLVSLASYDPDTSSLRTSQLSLLEGSTECLRTLPRSGSMRSGTVYQRLPLAPLTFAIESGLLPTPAAVQYGSNQGGAMGRTGPIRPSLATMARKGLWPTPTESDADSSGSRDSQNSRAHAGTTLTDFVRPDRWPTPTAQDAENDGGPAQMQRNSIPLNLAVKMWPTPSFADGRGGEGQGQSWTGGPSLRTAVRQWPTPKASDSNRDPGLASRYGPGQRRSNLKDALRHHQTKEGPKLGQLSPMWVGWLMGFPPSWTDLSGSESPASESSTAASQSA